MLLSPEEAWQIVADEIQQLGEERVSRLASAGRVLAADVVATVDVPPADVSAMDGYVVRDELALEQPLALCGESAAGHPPEFELEAHQVASIMTGAVVPRGGERVIPVEWTERQGERVVFHRDGKPGANIRRRGEVVEQGQPLLAAGSFVTAGGVSLLASHGHQSVQVRQRPTVRVLTTGDEIVPPEVTPARGQLRDSNTSFILAAARTLGIEVESLGIASDQREDLQAKIRRGLEADVLLLCGGVSKGEYDLVEEVLEQLGSRKLFDAVRIQPGKPLVAARHEGGMIFGLPGNPASVMVTFWLFVRPALRLLQGLDDGFWHGSLSGRLTAPLPGSRGRDRFLPAEIRFAEGELEVCPVAPQGSHDNSAYARGSAIVRIRQDQGPSPAGARCEILPLIDWPA